MLPPALTTTTRPLTSYKILGVVCVIMFTIVAVFFAVLPLHELRFHTPPEGLVRYWATFLVINGISWGFAALAWRNLYETLVRYVWDGDGITRITLVGQKSMRWSDVIRFRIRRWGGDCTYCLYDQNDQCLSVDIQLIGLDHPLHGMIKEKLAGLIRVAAQEIYSETTSIFSYRRFGIPCRAIRLSPEGITERKFLNKSSVRYEEIKAICQAPYNLKGIRPGETTILSDGRRERIAFDTQFKNYEVLVDFLRQRLGSVIWVDTVQKTPPTEPLPAWIYHQHRLSELKKLVRLRWLVIVICIPGLTILYTWAYASGFKQWNQIMIHASIFSIASLIIAYRNMLVIKEMQGIQQKIESLQPQVPEAWQKSSTGRNP